MTTLWLALSVQWDDCSAAIGREFGVIGERRATAGSTPATGALASRHALSLVADVLADHGVVLGEISRVCFARGPGAFTSVRVAAALAQGLGLALQRPVSGICSLAALVARSPRWSGVAGTPAEAWLQFSAMDARMGQVYYAVHRCEPGRHPVALAGPAVGEASSAIGCFAGFPSAAPDADCAGNGFGFPVLRDWALESGLDPATGSGREPGAASVLALARSAGAPAPGPAAAARPVYVRDKIALDVDEQRVLAADRLAGRTAA